YDILQTTRRAVCYRICMCFSFNDTATTEIYTLSLHDALPISPAGACNADATHAVACTEVLLKSSAVDLDALEGQTVELTGSLERSEEHTSELQSRENLVCRLLLEKKKKKETKKKITTVAIHTV